jgi:hypothetical protein
VRNIELARVHVDSRTPLHGIRARVRIRIMTAARDPETGEVVGPHWETRTDGTRHLVGDEPKRKRSRRKPANHMAPGTWRYDTDESGRKFKRALTAEETAQKERFRAEKEERDRQHRSLLASLVPTVSPEGECPAGHEQIFPMTPGKYPGRVLVELERPNGSTFVMTHRAFGGEDKGIEPFEYVNSYVRFAKNGLRYRTRGTMYASVEEMRASARALLETANRIEAAGEPMAERPHPLIRFPMPTEAGES